MSNLYDSRLQLAILQILKLNGDISQIVGGIYTYNDIRDVIKKFKINGIASDLSGVLLITEIGEKYLEELKQNSEITHKKPFILPQYKYFNRKMNEFDIYLKDRDVPR